MNRCIFSGRLTADPQISYLQGDKPKCCAKYTLAVPRSYSKTGEADFIRCVSFGRSAEVVEKYYRKGTKIIAEGRMQTGSYINKEGQNNLILAVGANRESLVRLLAENGADPDVKDMMGMSAYNYAVLFKKERLVEILKPFHKEI